MKPTRRPSVIVVAEKGILLWMPSPLISGGPLLCLPCWARVRYCPACCWEGGLLSKSFFKVDLMSDHFKIKHSSESVSNFHFPCVSKSYHPWCYRSSQVRYLLFDFVPNVVADKFGMFSLFLRKLLMFWCFSRVCELLRRSHIQDSLSACLKQTNVSRIPQGLYSSYVANYLPISII